MAARTQNLTQGSPGKLIFAFALPLMLGNVFQQLYTVVDTMVVGKALGVQTLAALGASDWLNWMMLGMVQGFTQGFAILMAQQFGAQRFEQLRRTVGASAVLAAASALALMLLGQVMLEPMLRLLNTPDAILPNTMLYLRIMFMGLPVVMAYNLFACILRALGDGQTPLHAMIVASGVNIALDLLFVLVFHWGIAGAAAATLIAQCVSGVFCLIKMRNIPILKLKVRDFCIELAMVTRLFGLGMPMAFQNAIIAIGGMILQSVVNDISVLFIAGFTATNKLYGILEIAATSYGYAMISYAGQNLGAGKLGRIRRGQRAAIGIAMVTSVSIAAVMIAFGRLILSGFISGTPQEIETTTEIAYEYLVVMSVFLPVLYVLHVTRSAIQGVGNTVLPMVSGIAEFVMRTGGAFLLPAMVGPTGIFAAEVLAWAGADMILVPSYFVIMRKREKQYFPNPTLAYEEQEAVYD